MVEGPRVTRGGDNDGVIRNSAPNGGLPTNEHPEIAPNEKCMLCAAGITSIRIYIGINVFLTTFNDIRHA